MFSHSQLTQLHAAAATSLPAVLDGPGGGGEPVSGVSGNAQWEYIEDDILNYILQFNSTTNTPPWKDAYICLVKCQPRGVYWI